MFLSRGYTTKVLTTFALVIGFSSSFFSCYSNDSPHANHYTQGATPLSCSFTYENDTHYKNQSQQLSQEIHGFFNKVEAYNTWHAVPHDWHDIPTFIGPKNSYHPGKRNKFIQQFSRFCYENGSISVRTDYKNLIQTFCKQVIGKHAKHMPVHWCSKQRSLQTLADLEHELAHNKRLQKNALNRLEAINGKNYLHPFIAAYRNNLLQQDRKEKFCAQRTVEKNKNKKIAQKQTKIKNDILKATAHLHVTPLQVKKECPTTIHLDQEKQKQLEKIRYSFENQKHIEASKTHLAMLDKIEIESFQNDGNVSKKSYNRVIACDKARSNNFAITQKTYALNDHVTTFAPPHLTSSLGQLKQYVGNDIQHNVHEEIVDFVNRYANHLHESNSQNSTPEIFEAADVALSLKTKLNGTNKSTSTKIYERTYSFLDFCHNLVTVKIGQAALFVFKHVGKGLELGRRDVQEFFQNGIQDYLHALPKADNEDVTLLGIINKEKNIEAIVEEQRVAFETKKKALGDAASQFFQKIKEQPLEDTIGDALEFLSRKLVYASAIIVTATLIGSIAHTGVAAATTISSAIAASKTLEPLIKNLSANGAAATELVATKDLSLWDTVATTLGQTTQALAGWLQPTGQLYCAMQGDGSENKNISQNCASPGNWLQQQEELGGHTIARHVGKSDQELLERLLTSRRITGSSSFTDVATAEKVIIKSINENKIQINSWLKEAFCGDVLTLDYRGSNIIGRGILRGEASIVDLSNARIIIKAVTNTDFLVLTAFPVKSFS